MSTRDARPIGVALLRTLVALVCAATWVWADGTWKTPTGRTERAAKARAQQITERVKQGHVDLIFVGDSITQGWERDGKEVWEKHYGARNAVNVGIDGDRTEHVLWRLDHGNVDGIHPKLAVVMIGANNCKLRYADQIAEGMVAVVNKLREKLPETKILLLGILPTGESPNETRDRLARASELAAKVADGKNVFYLDFGKQYLAADGTLPKSLMPDGVHPNEQGYRIWAEAMEPTVVKLMGEAPK